MRRIACVGLPTSAFENNNSVKGGRNYANDYQFCLS
jgi:hypothetical protein